MRLLEPYGKRMEMRKRTAVALVFPLGLGLLLWLLPVRADHDDPPAEPLPVDLRAEDLAQRAFELVEHQLREATSQERSSWASQPGAIRTFDEEGSQSRLYKLYSAPDMLASSSAEAQADLVADWDQRPAHFVDLNAPQSDGDSGLSFPIADPRVGPEGFEYYDVINGVVTPRFGGGAEDERRLPMPVQWIYLLQDGTRGYLDATRRFIGPAVPTEQNPIVGRIAFWADDNTAKVNLNTASEGVYWDMPRTDTTEDRGLSNSQPAAGEYQRHPGHPATVCLSSVLFPGQRIGTPEGGSGQMAPLALGDASLLWRIGNGIGTGGSRAGTVAVAAVTRSTPSPFFYSPYDSIGEVFQHLEANGIQADPEIESRASRSGFFLTTVSNAPELTLHDYPRVSVWPSGVAINSTAKNEFDLVAEPGGRRYLFERRSSSSRHSEYYSRPRNADLLSFLQVSTRRRLLGFGSSIADKYGSGPFSNSEQILAMVLDHARGVDLGSSGPRYSLNGQVSSICLCGGTSAHRGRWNRPEFADPFGGGRTFTISEVALVFHCTGWVSPDGATGFGDTDGLGAGQKRIQVGVVVEAFCPAHGFASITPEAGVVLSGQIGGNIVLSPLPDLRINDRPITSPSVQPLMVPPALPGPGGRGGGEFFLADGNGNGTSWTGEVILETSEQTMNFVGNQEEINLIVFDSQDFITLNNAVQVMRLKFPSAVIPAPSTPTDPTDWNTRIAQFNATGADLIRSSDVVRSLVVGHGDYRLVAGTRSTEEKVFQPHRDYDSPSAIAAHSLLRSDGSLARSASFAGQLVPNSNKPEALQDDVPLAPTDPSYAPRFRPLGASYPFSIDPAVTGDFDNGFGDRRDGPYLNRPDEGVVFDGGGDQYFDDNRGVNVLDSSKLHAPHRAMPGPAMFGSIPSGVRTGVPWRTLLFRPDPQHFGASSTPDHLWLDLFRMPAPLPHRDGRTRRGIGDWFSADGKINLNYQILPFVHIRRATAVHAALKAEKIMAIPTTDGASYKSPGGPDSYRHFIDADQTLQQWDQKFIDGEVFRSASEICDMYLVPEGVFLGSPEDGDYPGMRSFWAAHTLTGDNTKERPYAALYQHFTTRSNSYDIHVIAQTIVKSSAVAADVFDPALDQVGAEYCGSGQLTRYLDADSPFIPDYAADPLADPLTGFYEYRLSTNFTPAPRFEITEVSLGSDGNPTLVWRSELGEQFVVQRSLDLGDWEFVANVTATAVGATTTSFTDTSPPPGASRVFYRILKSSNN